MYATRIIEASGKRQISAAEVVNSQSAFHSRMACCSAPKDDITLSVHTVVVNLADEASLAKKGFSLFVPRPPTAVQWDEVVKWQARHKLPLNKQVKEIRVGDVVFQRQIIHDIRQLVVNIDYLTRGGHRLRRLENDHLIVEGFSNNVFLWPAYLQQVWMEQ